MLKPMNKATRSAHSLFLISVILCAVLTLGQKEDARKQSVKFSSLPAAEQLRINAAMKKWNQQFRRTSRKQTGAPAEALVTTVHLGPAEEDDLVLTDRPGCSPTGNCSILVVRALDSEYQVVLEGIGQSFALDRGEAHGLRDVVLRMHGSATESTVKSYRFNGMRYIRSACYNESFAILDSNGNLQELSEPRRTPCR